MMESDKENNISFESETEDISPLKGKQNHSLQNPPPQQSSPSVKPFSLGEEMINQGIETIEFVLGSISNTASYLRLWALSLAHNQLAKVFIDMIMLSSFSVGSGVVATSVKLVVSFVLFLVITFAVILVMDLMECFLHALRYVFFN
jgi:V-type H+-transporting ATPase subunit a